MTQFYDAATWQNIPHGTSACLYGDGRYAAPADAPKILGLTQYRIITVTGDYRIAGAIDFEPGNPCYDPRTLRRYVRGRRNSGHRARVYCDRADASEAWHGLTEGTDTNLRDYAEWWISTLDGTDWTPDELAADLASRWGAPIPAGKLWGNQNRGGMTAPYDESNLFGQW